MGVLGMVLGAAGLGFVLLRNFNSRRKEFAIMAATGFSQKYIRMYIVKDQAFIVFWGILTGTVSGLIATLTSLGSGTAVPWTTIIIMTILIAATATAALFLSVRKIRTESLIVHLRNE
jgi:ABC-type antimicrobial peptide transport system permease subunit